MASERRYWWIVLVAGAVGIAATITQIVERITLAKDPDAELVCDFSSTVSCGGVLTAWQSSALGVPNASIGLAVFAFFTSAAVSGLLGSQLSRAFRYVLVGFALFMLGFTLWFLFQSTFVLNAVCVYCLAIGLAVVSINFAALRLLVADGGLDRGGAVGFARRFITSGDDRWLWLALVVGIGVAMFIVLG